MKSTEQFSFIFFNTPKTKYLNFFLKIFKLWLTFGSSNRNVTCNRLKCSCGKSSICQVLFLCYEMLLLTCFPLSGQEQSTKVTFYFENVLYFTLFVVFVFHCLFVSPCNRSVNYYVTCVKKLCCLYIKSYRQYYVYFYVQF